VAQVERRVLDDLHQRAPDTDIPGLVLAPELLPRDEVTVEVTVRDGRVDEIAFMGSGCSISQSSASMMTEAVLDKPVSEVRGLIGEFTSMMRGSDEVDYDALGDLEAMQGVRKFPVRVKCATLAWHTLEEALEQIARP